MSRFITATLTLVAGTLMMSIPAPAAQPPAEDGNLFQSYLDQEFFSGTPCSQPSGEPRVRRPPG